MLQLRTKIGIQEIGYSGQDILVMFEFLYPKNFKILKGGKDVNLYNFSTPLGSNMIEDTMVTLNGFNLVLPGLWMSSLSLSHQGLL